jgi:hypothetical protein
MIAIQEISPQRHGEHREKEGKEDPMFPTPSKFQKRI